jgi:hypothetical protein
VITHVIDPGELPFVEGHRTTGRGHSPIDEGSLQSPDSMSLPHRRRKDHRQRVLEGLLLLAHEAKRWAASSRRIYRESRLSDVRSLATGRSES